MLSGSPGGKNDFIYYNLSKSVLNITDEKNFSEKKDAVVFFDGICVLCNGFVDFILKLDKKHKFKFAPLQGQSARDLLSSVKKIPDSVVFYDGFRIYFKSTAALKILFLLGGIWKLTILLFIFPSFIRDRVYDFIAKNRYAWFGKKDICRIPSADEKKYFLD